MEIKIGGIYYLFSMIYTFMVWGFWWGVLSLICPIFPIIDLIRYIIIPFLDNL